MKDIRFYSQDSGQGYYNTPQPPPPPPPGYTPPQQGTSTNAILALVFGILSYVGCSIISAIPAWIIGKNEIDKINSGQSPESNRTMATIGMWLGIIGVILFAVAIIVFIILIALGFFTTSTIQHYGRY